MDMVFCLQEMRFGQLQVRNIFSYDSREEQEQSKKSV